MPHRLAVSWGTKFAPPRRPQRMIAIALLAAVLFNQPLLRVFDRGPATTLVGVPIIYLYLFAAWALVIVLMISVVERREKSEPGDLTPSADRGEGTES